MHSSKLFLIVPLSFLLLFLGQTTYPGQEVSNASQQTVVTRQELTGQEDDAIVEKDLPPKKDVISVDFGNVTAKFQVKYRPESFFGDNIHRFNNSFDADRIIFSRHILDTNFSLQYGVAHFDHVAAEFFASFRIKAIWGSPGSITVTEEPIKFIDTITGRHSHYVKLEVPRFREIWFSFNIEDALQIGFKNEHYFTVGTFPFELGRGISLGNAFAVNQGFLGFYADNAVDQYAPGYKFFGEIVKDKLTYDLYGAIIQNLSDNFKNTNAAVYGQEYGREATPQRGFGKVDYIIAGRLRWTPYDDDNKMTSLEPYALYSHAPEQRVEFLADASSNLGTFGLAGEFRKGDFEFGFDGAVNCGAQKVRSWDRNLLQLQNKIETGNYPRVVQVNSKVIAEEVAFFGGPVISKSKAVFVSGSPAQDAIFYGPEAEAQNGQLIGNTTFTLNNQNVQLRNDPNRFRDGYVNKLSGWMVVADAAYTICSGDMKLAGMVGVASGDEDPNKVLDNPNASKVDGNYGGFVGLQEIYCGDRVRSVFLLGGAGRAPRPLSTPAEDAGLESLPTLVSGFTNLILVGTSFSWEPKDWSRKFKIMPNLLSYWLEHKTKAFDITTGQSSATKYADRHLGYEGNILMDFELLSGIRLYGIGSVFVPGAFYKDIKGTPLTAAEQAFLDIDDPTGFDLEVFPLLSNNLAYTINFGIEAKF